MGITVTEELTFNNGLTNNGSYGSFGASELHYTKQQIKMAIQYLFYVMEDYGHLKTLGIQYIFYYVKTVCLLHLHQIN